MTGFTPASISRANSSSVLQADLSTTITQRKLLIEHVLLKQLYEIEKTKAKSSSTFDHIRHWELEDPFTITSDELPD